MIDDLSLRIANAKAFLGAHHLGHVADLAQLYLFNWQVYALAFLPALVAEKLFPLQKRRVWSPNLAFDFCMPIFDGVLFGGLLNGLAMAGLSVFFTDHPPFWELRLLDDSPLWIQGIAAYLTATLAAYVAHRLLHKIPFLWHFHSVHHSQKNLNPFTTKRAHVVEDILTLAFVSIPIGVIGGSYPTWFWIPVLNGWWSFFIHANAKLHFGPFRFLLVSPQMHRIHHSTDPKHYNKNFGTELAIWDYLFGTAYAKHDEYPEETGVRDYPVPEETARTPWGLLRTWLALNVHPFRENWRALRSIFRRGLPASRRAS